MTKELSKQLCELCGVEPKTKELQCKDCPSQMEECGCFDCEIKVYPDFGKPNNFVKLIYVVSKFASVDFRCLTKYECKIISQYGGYAVLDNKFEKSFIKVLINMLANNDRKSVNFYLNKEAIKQTIKNTEWEY